MADTQGLEELINQLWRFGKVSRVKGGMAKVIWQDLDGLESDWLWIGQRNTLENKDHHAYDIGEQVAVLCRTNGTEAGVILCAVPSEKAKPAEDSIERRHLKFKDGTEIYYDRDKSELVVKINGKLRIEIAQTAEIVVQGAVDIDVGGSTDVDVGGNLTTGVTGAQETSAAAIVRSAKTTIVDSALLIMENPL